MSQMHVAATGFLIFVLSALLSLLIANWRESRWLNARRAEQLYYEIEHLGFALYKFFCTVAGVQDATTRLHNIRALANIEQRLTDLMIRTGVHFAKLLPRFTIILSATSTAYNALERLADASPAHSQRALETFDYCVVNLKDSIEQAKGELLIAGRPSGLWRYLSNCLRPSPRQAPTIAERWRSLIGAMQQSARDIG
jgi:hypothetical protein